jgi:mannose-6-phosphate isomerase-like protein (cupin superfamily)
MSIIYNEYEPYPYPYWVDEPMYPSPQMYNVYEPYPYVANTHMHISQFEQLLTDLRDYGPEPFVVNIEEATKENNTFRTALWTGENFQVTLMSIEPGDDIGLEIHPTVDQFIRIEEGQGLVEMGNNKDELDFQQEVYDDFAIMVPAGKWHNITNTGNSPLKLYAIYAPPEHPRDTVHQTKADAEAAEELYHY